MPMVNGGDYIAAASASDANFRMLSARARDGILVDNGRSIVFANPAMSRLLGYAPEELEVRSLRDILRPDDYDEIVSRLHEDADSIGDSGLYETVLLPKQGDPVDVEISAAMTLWENRPSFLLLARDITDRKKTERELIWRRNNLESLVSERTFLLERSNDELRSQIAKNYRAQEALRRSEALLSAAQRLAKTGAWEWTAGNDSMLFTEEACRIHGFETQVRRVRYERFLQCVRPTDRSRVAGALYRAVEKTSDFDLEYRINRTGGEERVVRVFGTALRDQNQEQTRVLGAVQDVTEAHSIGRMKREFVSVVSHELRTPLTAIRGALGLLKALARPKLDGESPRLLDIASRNVERLSALVNDILDIEKLQAGQMQFVFEPVDIVAFVHEAIEANKTYADQFGVFLRLLRADPVRVICDPKRLHQVMANLISNAVKFSPRGGTVDISVVVRAGQARFTIADHGCGIEDSFRERIFEKFTQQDASDSRVKGGTGLGLAITKSIIEQSGGTIDFASKRGQGTSFFFELPQHVDLAARVS